MNAVRRIREYLKTHGTGYTLRRLGQIASERYLGSWDRKRTLPSAEDLRRQRENPPACGLISVVIPVYRTDPAMLEALIACLRAQTWTHFEAILYDGGGGRAETRQVLERAVREADGAEPVFRLIDGGENRGISGNTNAAIRECRGEFVALCDHDDLLSPEALWYAADAIARNPGADVIYTDEDRVMENGLHHMDPHFKPDFSPEYLVSDNYICHLAVIRKRRLEEIGGLRSGFDGSQDHDLFLRLAGITDRFVHVPRVLYSWREVRSSRSHTDLETCLWSSCRAAEEAEAARGRTLTAVPVGKVLRLWYDVDPETTVEALILGGSGDECRECLLELEERTSWRNLSAALIVTDPESRFAALNEAAAESRADVLLVLDAGIRGMNRHFIRELLMYAQMEDIAGVSPILTDRRGRITHAGFALGMEGAAQCINEGLLPEAGGRRDLMNKTRNVSAVSAACMMVRRSAWEPFPEGYRTGLAAAELALLQQEKGRRFVVTPHARAVLGRGDLLLSGRARDPEDLARLEKARGRDLRDPYYSAAFRRDRANYGY